MLIFELDAQANEYRCEKEYAIYAGEESVVRIAQSLTGNIINASVSEKEESKTLVFT